MAVAQLTSQKRVHCDRSTVYRVLERESETGTVHDRPRSGRKRKLTREEEQVVVRKARKVGAIKAAREYSLERSKNINEHTVRRTMKRHKFLSQEEKIPKLKAKDKERRMDYAREMMTADWRMVLFTDEKSFWLGTPTEYGWQQLAHRIEVETSKWTLKLHV